MIDFNYSLTNGDDFWIDAASWTPPSKPADIPKTVEVRVKLGADLLDQKAPGWLARINLDTLQLGDCENCILGQIYGHFALGLVETGLIDEAEDNLLLKHGFVGHNQLDTLHLEAEWCIVVAARRASEMPMGEK